MKKDPELTLKKRVKALEAKNTELVNEINELNRKLPISFNAVAKAKKALEKRVAHLEEFMLIKDFKRKIAGK